jgi:hypothetical protein
MIVALHERVWALLLLLEGGWVADEGLICDGG